MNILPRQHAFLDLLRSAARRTDQGVAIGLLLLATAFAGAFAQEFPNRIVRLLTITGAGGGADVIARVVGPELSQVLGQPVVVQNMPGGGGLVAHRYLLSQPADGYTVLVSTGTAIVVPIFVKAAGFDIVNDHLAVTMAAETPLVLSTNAVTPYSTFNEMVAYARANPGKLNHGVTSSADLNGLIMEAVRQRFGLKIVDVPYKGSSPAYTIGLLGNEVQLIITAPSTILGQVKAGQIRILATSGNRRLSELAPNAPTFAEAGVPDVSDVGFPVFVAKGTPGPIVKKLADSFTHALQTQKVREVLGRSGYQIVSSSPEVATQTITKQIDVNRALAKKIGITPQ